jgi:murein DD-endopeptidase MepM/ murein hydrolase activator NlpD
MSRFTRIILINDEQQGMREFNISHRMIWLLGILGVALATLVAYVLITYGTVMRQAARVPDLERRLTTASADLATMGELRAELEATRSLQERLLLLLGIEGQGIDSTGAAPSSEGLGLLASAVMTPPPDAWPAAGYVTQEFVEDQVARGIRPHTGLDIAGPEGAPILAAGDGVVARAGEDPYLGNYVEIQHGLGYLTVYGHCSSVAVARGEQVRRGQVVAYLGETGEASAPHLHFEIWHNGMAVDPRRFLSGEPPAQ